MEYDPVSLKYCDFNKGAKTLILSSEFYAGHFPSEVVIKSHHTGRIVRFCLVRPGDPVYDEDQYDGEMQLYRASEPLRNVDFLCLQHQW